MAAAIRQAIAEGWSVCDAKTGAWRPARWSDVAVLLPARTSLRALERALERDGVPYRAETSSLVYGTGEIRDLLMVARAVEDPTDSLAVVAALRTAAFGCGDDDLYVWRQTHGGRWDHQGPVPAAAPGRRHRRPGAVVAGEAAPGAAVAGAQPGPGAHRAGAAAHGGGVRAPPAPGPVAAAALRRRPVPGLGGGRRHHVAGVPGLGPPAVGRRGAGDRDRATGDRRRCRAHPHHPRRQGPRVPHHRAVGPDHAAQPAPGRGPGALPARGGAGPCISRRTWRPPSSPTTSPSRSRWTGTSACASCTWPPPGPATT